MKDRIVIPYRTESLSVATIARDSTIEFATKTIIYDHHKVDAIIYEIQEKMYRLEAEGFRPERIIVGVNEYEQILAAYHCSANNYFYDDKLFGLDLIVELGSKIEVTTNNRNMLDIQYRRNKNEKQINRDWY